MSFIFLTWTFKRAARKAEGHLKRQVCNSINCRAEQHNLRASGLSYNPAVAQTSCISLPFWSPFQNVTWKIGFTLSSYLIPCTHNNNESRLLFLCNPDICCIPQKCSKFRCDLKHQLLTCAWEGFHTYLGRHSRDTFLSEQDVNERKTQKIQGLW